MDKDIQDSRNKAIESLATAIGFWGVDPLEAKVYGTLYMSPRPLTLIELIDEFGCCDSELGRVIKTLKRLGAVKEMAGKGAGEKYYEAETDFFEILQTVNRERREREMGAALQEISDQRAYIEYKYDEEGTPELKFLVDRLAGLERFIGIIDKAMFGLKALAGIRNIFKSK
jgi:DNA-binding transcriptional regulator GbsR (MarR family)